MRCPVLKLEHFHMGQAVRAIVAIGGIGILHDHYTGLV
jgi:hypothetical protein